MSEMSDAIVERACAKVNLHLEVLRRREDGYHDLETVMHEISLHDTLILRRSQGETRLTIDDPTLPTGEENLALRALRALERRLSRSLPASIDIIKRIPAGGGLGGGSSDAAAVLRGLRRLHGLDVDDSVLESIAAEFGSDTSFFVRGGTSFCTGRGEVIEALAVPHTLDFVLVLPGITVPTPQVFRALRLTGSEPQGYDRRRCLEQGDVTGIRQGLFNRLEEPARRLFPELDVILTTLAPHRPLMSGSGSTIFVLCDDESDAATRSRAIALETGLRCLPARSMHRDPP